jgi:hypothetical protein
VAVTNSSFRYGLTEDSDASTTQDANEETFDVIVGEAGVDQQRFTLHTDVFTERSEFFRVARSPEWLANPSKPVDLTDDDPEVFLAYMNCVYFGIEILGGHHWPLPESDDSMEDKELEDAFRLSEHECEKRGNATHGNAPPFSSKFMEHLRLLTNVYLQADRLQDFTTANLVIDEISDFEGRTNHTTPDDVINTVYESTVHGSPLRKLMRDSGLHERWSGYYLDHHRFKYHEDYTRDVLVEFLRVRDTGRRKFVDNVYGVPFERRIAADRCTYHIHDRTELLEENGSESSDSSD